MDLRTTVFKRELPTLYQPIPMGFLDNAVSFLHLPGKRKPVDHKLKWKIPEGRFTIPIDDADKIVFQLEKKIRAKFVSGGEFSEAVHAKQFGEGVFAYWLVRTNKKTEEETVVADAYMIQEEDIRLGMDVTSAYKLEENLENMGYTEAFVRQYRVWRFQFFEVSIGVYDIEGFGEFVEFAIPATNFEKARERAEKKVFDLLAKLSLKKEDAVPTDVITLQLMQSLQDAQDQQARGKGAGGKNVL